jgi:hypothetical protein
MLLAGTAGNYPRLLIAAACLVTLAISSFLSVSAITTHREPEPRQYFGTFISALDAGPLCQKLVFDNYTSLIVSSKDVDCNPIDPRHNLEAPLATLRRGFTSK